MFTMLGGDVALAVRVGGGLRLRGAVGVARLEVAPGGDREPLAERGGERADDRIVEQGRVAERQHRREAARVRGDRLDRDPGLAFFVIAVGEREQPADGGVALVVLAEQRDARRRGGIARGRAREGELGADEQALPALLRLGVGPDHAVEAVAVAQAHGVEPELGGALDHLLGVRRALEEGEARAAEELGEPGRAPSPGRERRLVVRSRH